MGRNNGHFVMKGSDIYKFAVSIILGLIGFMGIFYSSRFDFNGFSINFAWSIILPLLVALAWGMKYGIISITLGLTILYPFILGRYNGWASIVPAISLLMWIMIHGYGGQKRLAKYRFYYNIYFLQFVYIVMRMIIYITFFPALISLNPPFWNPQAYTRIEIGIILLFTVKGIIVESIFLALCDALLLLPFVRKIFRLDCSKGAKYNTRIMSAIVAFGLCFTLIVQLVQNYIIDKNYPFDWVVNPDEKTRIAFLLATILFFIMGGITVRYFQRVLETQEQLKIQEKHLEHAVDEIKILNEKLEQRVEERTSELKNAISELEGFAYTISHDLKAPLRAIEGYTNFIREDYGDSLESEANEMVGNIQEVCKDMIGLINKLLEYSVTSKASICKELVEAKQVISAVFREFQVANSRRKMELVFEGNIPKVIVDRVLFREAIVNIISNSVKFSRNREITKITAGCIKSKSEYIFYIKDNGVGFDMKYSNKLFNIFQRLHRSKDFEGTGIGLATIKKIIQKHGGRVWIEGVVNEGAIVYFTIPSVKDIQNEGRKCLE